MKRLSNHELGIMKAVWSAEEAVTRPALEGLLEDYCWSANTLNTYLTRLTAKGFLACTKAGRGNAYTPLVTREEYQTFEGEAVVNQVFGGSVSALLAAVSGRKQLSEEDVDELRAYLDGLKGGS